MKLKEQETNRIQTFNKITSANIRLLMRNVVAEITHKKTNS